MSNREFTAQRTMLANAMATAGAELLEYMGVSSALAAIPNTEPPQYVVAGTLAMIAKVLPAASVPPLTAPAPLTDLTVEELMGALKMANERLAELTAAPAPQQSEGLSEKYILDTYHYQFAIDGGDIEKAVVNTVSVLAKAALAAPVQTAEKPHDLTIREAFDAVGGWMNGGEMGYPSFGSFEALSIYTTKMIRSFLANKAWHEGLAAPVQAEEALDEDNFPISVSTYGSLEECEKERARRAAVQAEQAQAEPLVFDDFPDFNAQAMGCGLEDRGITDRYDAMRYGFEEALDLVDERIKNFLADFVAPPVAAPVQAEQAQAEPIAELEVALSYQKVHISRDSVAKLPIGEYSLYLAPVTAVPAQAEQAAAVRAAALEEAARACVDLESVRAIRALAAPSTATSNDTAALGDTGGAK